MLKRFLTVSSVGTIFLVSCTTAIAFIILIVVGSVYEPLLLYMGRVHLFEIGIYVVLLEVLLLQIIHSGQIQLTRNVAYAKSEDEFHQRLLNSIKKKKIECVQIFSSGLWSRRNFIEELMSLGIDVRVVLPKKPIGRDKSDAKSADAVIDAIFRENPEPSHNKFLTVKRVNAPASIRAIIAVRAQPEECEAIVTWYTYGDGYKAIGHHNPVIYLHGRMHNAKIIINFVKREFEKLWTDSGSILVDRTS